MNHQPDPAVPPPTGQCRHLAQPGAGERSSLARDILDRLDPDMLHPARLAGPHAWTHWGLTAVPPDGAHLRLLVPARDQRRAAPRVLTSVAEALERPTWPPQPPVSVTQTRGQILIDYQGERASIEVASPPWYLPVGRAPRTTDVLTPDGWPIVDEFTALRERVDALHDPPTLDDVRDLAHWTATKAAQARNRGALIAPISELAHRLRREAPTTYEQLTCTLNTCKRADRKPHPERAASSLAYLADQISQPEHARRR